MSVVTKELNGMQLETRDFEPHCVRTRWTYKQGKRTARVSLAVKFGLHLIAGNSQPHFSITVDGLDDGHAFGGAQHGLVLQHFPQLADLIELHFSHMDGSPLYAVENGWYWLSGIVEVGARIKPDFPAERCRQFLRVHLRIPEEEVTTLIALVENWVKTEGVESARRSFARWIEGLRPRWRAEARAAIVKYELGVFGDNPLRHHETLEKFDTLPEHKNHD